MTIICVVFLAILLVSVIKRIMEYAEYENSSYKQITSLSYQTIRKDKGKSGEYLAYKGLKDFELYGAKFLFNVYIPKTNGETTEIDVLMICSKGIFVFESKNYSGWIFGSESQKQWCQILPVGRGRSKKRYFYNPIRQNRSHITYLKAFLGEQIPMYSIIAFSERCTLKSVPANSNEVKIINRDAVFEIVWDIYKNVAGDILNVDKIDNIYNRLYPYSQVDENSRSQHIVNIHNNLL